MAPKDGLYASPGKDFVSECMESGYFYIDFAERSIDGNEWSCKVKRLTDTAPSSVKLDVTCNDYNTLTLIDVTPMRMKEVQGGHVTQADQR